MGGVGRRLEGMEIMQIILMYEIVTHTHTQNGRTRYDNIHL